MSGGGAKAIFGGIISFFLTLISFIASGNPVYESYSKLGPPLKALLSTALSSLWQPLGSLVDTYIPANLILFGVTLVCVSTVLIVGLSMAKGWIGIVAAFILGCIFIALFLNMLPFDVTTLFRVPNPFPSNSTGGI